MNFNSFIRKHKNLESYCNYWTSNKYEISSYSTLDENSLNLLKLQLLQNRFQKSVLDSFENSNLIKNTFFNLNFYDSYPLLYLIPSTSKENSLK